MPKEFVKKYLPDPEKLKNTKSLGFLADMLSEPNFWHLNRRSVSRAFALGLFWGAIPMPFQMVASALIAMRIGANVPLSIVVVWYSNPITMPPIFYFEYLVGTWLLQMPSLPFEYELSVEWMLERAFDIGVPMYLGALVVGLVIAALGHFIVNFLWVQNVRKRWRTRHQKK